MSYYAHFKAYEATKDSTNRESVNAALLQHGFSLGRRSIDAAHKEYAAWLTSHGLDVTRGDLDQQALINDHRATVKKIIALNKKGGKKDLKTVSDLLRELSNDGIYILDVTRLERCLMLTDQKAKTYAKAKSAKKRNGAKHRATRYAEADADITLQQKFDELLQHVIIDTGFDHDEAEAYLMGMIEDRGGNADGYDLQILEAVEAAII
jgi:hypothetical protein